ncbi:hypothetical protein [Cupriavidus sp. IK-TO18]|uniref:hypothetical protein n=1 Tax=Cupriavidus sp. IK-TO18 TaxID=2782182 RepID=UPI001898C8F4|nr:hypothetical protein [Cupriavidus sp. IK-TO18]MBF6987254.1 hypothetical protein [Cupriavidus sp. IK-TO18]
MSKASDIAVELSNRIARITKANGFNTDIGLRVFRGKRAFSEDDLPCLVLVEGNDTPQDDALTAMVVSQRYVFEAHTECDPDHPNDAAHLVIADLKRAIFAGEPKLGMRLNGKAKGMTYKGRVIGAREDGAPTVFAGIHIDVLYVEDLTNP